MPDLALDPWERLPDETDAAWVAFAMYRDQGAGNRSHRKLQGEGIKSVSSIGQWSMRHQWRRRVEAWDREQDTIRRLAMAEQLEAIVRRQSTSLHAGAQALLVPINAYLQRIQMIRKNVGDGEMFRDMTTADLAREARAAARLIPALVQCERLVHGLSTAGSGQIVEDQSELERQRVAGLSRSELEGMLTG